MCANIKSSSEEKQMSNLAGNKVPFSTLGFAGFDGSVDWLVGLLPHPSQPLRRKPQKAWIKNL